ncbi:MAG: FkbM family methyltransferase [Bacteroidetes bacterium]|nr:MAG: FkbM family methyltransferase [Bacteroidota bacterium]
MVNVFWKIRERLYTYLSGGPFGNLIHKTFSSIKSEAFIVVIGANDGITNDPLHQVRVKKGWGGLFVEPQQEVFKKLQENLCGERNLFFENSAIVNSSASQVMLYKHDDPNLSVMATTEPRGSDKWVKKEVVSALTFDELCDKYNLIDKGEIVLQIDIEGAEADLIYSINYQKIRPAYILYEHRYMTYNDHLLVNSFLQEKGYKIYRDRWDTLAVLGF